MHRSLDWCNEGCVQGGRLMVSRQNGTRIRLFPCCATFICERRKLSVCAYDFRILMVVIEYVRYFLLDKPVFVCAIPCVCDICDRCGSRDWVGSWIHPAINAHIPWYCPTLCGGCPTVCHGWEDRCLGSKGWEEGGGANLDWSITGEEERESLTVYIT